ncbi:MAG: HDOD domain-containing protein [Rhodocyclaceae bacterium]|nr:HDOD domain-containing protein [Rhodocyclaceae bacterium]
MAEASDASATTWPKVPDAWVNILARNAPPVLKRSQDELAKFEESIYDIPVRFVANVVESDPMMTVNLMLTMGRYQSSRPTEIENIEEALMMLGCGNFAKRALTLPTIDAVLVNRPEALLGALRCTARARRAAMLARTFARLRLDRNEGAAALAALLYEITDLLAWIYAPDKMLQFEQVVRENPRRKLALTRWMEFGFEWDELELKVLRRFKLPELIRLLIKPTDDAPLTAEMVRLAVEFSRRLANPRDVEGLQSGLRKVSVFLKVPVSVLVQELRLENSPIATMAAEDDKRQRSDSAA